MTVLPVVKDNAFFSVDDLRSALYLSSIHEADRLMAEANDENRNFRVFQNLEADPRLFGPAGTWGQDDSLRRKLFDFSERGFVIERQGD